MLGGARLVELRCFPEEPLSPEGLNAATDERVKRGAGMAVKVSRIRSGGRPMVWGVLALLLSFSSLLASCSDSYGSVMDEGMWWE